MKKVWTPSGYHLGPVNSLVGKGESIIDYNNGTGTLVTKGQKGVDNQPSSVKEGDQNVIAGNDIDWSNGIKFSDQAAPLTAKLQMYNQIENKASKSNRNMSSLSKQTQQLQQQQIDQAKQPILQNLKLITDRQQKQHDIENYAESMNKYDKGKSSWYSRYTTSGPGKVSNSTIDLGYLAPTILERKMLRHWMNEQPIMPNIYAANKYGPIALDALNRLRVDPYNQLRALDSKERAAYYRMQQNGGYTGGQRQAARIALALGNAKQAADILNATQLQNNQYRSQWADAALQEGNQDAARRQAAAQYGWEAYNRAHGAKTKGIETHLANIGALGQKWLQQRIKNKQYGDILNIYQQDIDNKKDALKTIYGIDGDGNKSTTGNTGSTGQRQSKGGVNPDALPGTKPVVPTTLSSSIGNIAPGWTPSGYRFISPNQQYAINRAVQNNQKALAAARNKEAFDRLMYGDYGSGRINFNNTLKGSLYTNGTYLNSLLPFELWAGPDGEFAPRQQYPLTWGDYVS